jgi:hypothetical protein
MKERATDRLIELHHTLDIQAKKFAELRNELVKEKSFALANDLYKVEEYVYSIMRTSLKLLKDLTNENK